MWGIKYGVDDKAQAAALVLSVLLILLLFAAIFVGAFVDRPWVTDIFKLGFPALTFVSGVAIGKGGGKSK